MARALLVVMALSLGLSTSAHAEEPRLERETSMKHAVLLTIAPTMVAGTVLLSLVGAGALIGSAVMAGYVIGGAKPGDTYALRAVPVYAVLGLVLGALAAIPLALMADVLTNFTVFEILALRDRPADIHAKSAHLWAGLAPPIAAAIAFVLAGGIGGLFLVNRARQGGLERDAFGTVMGSVGVMGLALIPALAVILAVDVGVRGALFWWLSRDTGSTRRKLF